MIIRHATLLTRGFVTDYRYLSSADSDWWEPQLTRLTDPTRPMVLLKTLPDEVVRLRIAGINSERRDRVGTRIRFDLSLELSVESITDRAQLTQLLHLFTEEVGDISKTNQKTTLGSRLDVYFDEAFIEASLHTPAPDSEVKERLLRCLIESPWEDKGLIPSPPARWVWSGGVEHPQARALWVSCVRTALDSPSKPRSIYMLNTVSRPGGGEEQALRISQAVLGRGQAPPSKRVNPYLVVGGVFLLGAAVGVTVYLLTR